MFAALLKEPAVRLFRRLAFGSRVELSYGWSHLPIYFIDSPLESFRSLQIEVVAGKHGEFNIAGGEIHIVRGRKWVPLMPLSELMNLPWIIPANRSDARQVDGTVVANAIKAVAPEEPLPLRIRIRVQDLHRQKADSGVLEVTPDELRRKKVE